MWICNYEKWAVFIGLTLTGVIRVEKYQEEEILGTVYSEPNISTRKVVTCVRVDHKLVWQVLCENG